MPLERVATADTTPRVAHGVLQRIDLVDREVSVRQANGPVTYSVSPDCEVLLNGERVKLRLLGPRDRVRVAYLAGDDGPVAVSLEARTRSPRGSAADPTG